MKETIPPPWWTWILGTSSLAISPTLTYIITWDDAAKTVNLLELTVPYDTLMEVTSERKTSKHTELQQCTQGRVHGSMETGTKNVLQQALKMIFKGSGYCVGSSFLRLALSTRAKKSILYPTQFTTTTFRCFVRVETAAYN